MPTSPAQGFIESSFIYHVIITNICSSRVVPCCPVRLRLSMHMERNLGRADCRERCVLVLWITNWEVAVLMLGYNYLTIQPCPDINAF